MERVRLDCERSRRRLAVAIGLPPRPAPRATAGSAAQRAWGYLPSQRSRCNLRVATWLLVCTPATQCHAAAVAYHRAVLSALLETHCIYSRIMLDRPDYRRTHVPHPITLALLRLLRRAVNLLCAYTLTYRPPIPLQDPAATSTAATSLTRLVVGHLRFGKGAGLSCEATGRHQQVLTAPAASAGTESHAPLRRLTIP